MVKAKYTQLKKFFTKYPTQKFSKNSIILEPGEKIEDLYFMKSGYVRVFTKTDLGENTLNFFKPLYLISTMHLFVNQPNEFYFQALTPVETYVMPRSDFDQLQKNNPEIASIMMEFFMSSLLLCLNNQGNIINGNALSKVASVLLQLGHNYGEIKNEQLNVNFPASHRIIANIVGLTRETTSVQMSKLQKQGVISTKRTQFLIRNLEKLESIVKAGE